MAARRYLAFTAAFLILAYLGLFFAVIVDQPYYHAGVAVNLRSDGFHVTKVAAGSPAAQAGLAAGMVITQLGGIDATYLYRLSVADLGGFLTIAARLFATGGRADVRLSDGSQVQFQTARLAFFDRVWLLSGEVVSNVIIGALFVAAGVWLLAIGGDAPAVGWFFLFTVATGIALPAGFFVSYWSSALLIYRFVILDVAGMVAGIALMAFARRFPDGPALSGRLRFLLVIPAAVFVAKYGAVTAGLADFFGNAVYTIHVFLVGTLIATIVQMVRRYRAASPASRRRLRWVVAGVIVSLVPYIAYMAIVVGRGSVLEKDVAIFSYVAGFGLVLFPVFVGIGVVRHNLFDIDRFLTRLSVALVLGLGATALFALLFFTFVDTVVTAQLYVLFVGAILSAPVAHARLNGVAQLIATRYQPDRGRILVEMERSLVGKLKPVEVYPIVAEAILYSFNVESVAFLRRFPTHDHLEFVHPRNTLRIGDVDRAPVANGLLSPLTNKAQVFPLADGVEQGPLLLHVGAKRDGDLFTADDVLFLSSAAAQVSKTLQNCELYRQLEESVATIADAQRTMILALAKLTEYRDNETGRHLERIQEYTRLLATEYARVGAGRHYLTKAAIDELSWSAILHDIGKVGVPDRILLKPGPLTGDEFTVVKKHPVIGGQVLDAAATRHADHAFLSTARVIAYQHHERWDGTGYPQGVAGYQIALPARLVAVADVYDALRSVRPYKPAIDHEKACAVIQAGAGTHFDPGLVSVFVTIQAAIAAVPR